MAEIVLVGTNHYDHKGPERLERVLNHYNPNIICLEATPEFATEEWKEHLLLMDNFDQKPLRFLPNHRVYSPEQIERARLEFKARGYELWIPRTYKNKFPETKLYCIDINSDEADELLRQRVRAHVEAELKRGKTIEQAIAIHKVSEVVNFIEEGSVEKHQEYVDQSYDNKKLEDEITKYGEDLFRILVSGRDDIFAERIRILAEQNPEKRIIAVHGANHIFRVYGFNVYDRLSDLKPKRMKLKEADNL